MPDHSCAGQERALGSLGSYVYAVQVGLTSSNITTNQGGLLVRHSVNGGGYCGRMASHGHAAAVGVMTVIRRGALIGGEFTTTNVVLR